MEQGKGNPLGWHSILPCLPLPALKRGQGVVNCVGAGGEAPVHSGRVFRHQEQYCWESSGVKRSLIQERKKLLPDEKESLPVSFVTAAWRFQSTKQYWSSMAHKVDASLIEGSRTSGSHHCLGHTYMRILM